MADTSNNVFIDANILMELFFARASRQKVMETLLAKGAEAEHVASILSVHILFYYVEKEKKQKSDAHDFLQSYRILDMNEADYEWAMANDQGDFEDALQIACALRQGCKKFLTLDQGLKQRHHKHLAITLIR